MPDLPRSLLLEAIEKGRAVHLLKNLKLSAVAVVDVGANPYARVVMCKRATEAETVTELAKRAAAFKAVNRLGE